MHNQLPNLRAGDVVHGFEILEVAEGGGREFYQGDVGEGAKIPALFVLNTFVGISGQIIRTASTRPLRL
jgi:hypothetical protein